MSLVPFIRNQKPAYRSGFDDFDRIFENLFGNALTNLATPSAGASALSLRLNVAESQTAYHVEAELPGIEEKDVDVSVKDGVLIIAGEKRHEEETKDKTFHRIERSYGSFQRSLQLPADADEDAIEAHMKNGILELVIGKRKEATMEPRKISIKRK